MASSSANSVTPSTHATHPIHAHHPHAHTLPLPSPRPSLGLSTAPAAHANSGLRSHHSSHSRDSAHSEDDPDADASGGEHTARPQNAHVHAAFHAHPHAAHAQSLPLPAALNAQRHGGGAGGMSGLMGMIEGDKAALLTMDESEDAIGMGTLGGPGSMSNTLGLSGALSRPLTHPEAERLKFFLATAPSRWDVDGGGAGPSGSGQGGEQSYFCFFRWLWFLGFYDYLLLPLPPHRIASAPAHPSYHTSSLNHRRIDFARGARGSLLCLHAGGRSDGWPTANTGWTSLRTMTRPACAEPTGPMGLSCPSAARRQVGGPGTRCSRRLATR
ncbi:hypothetical protein C8F04DRAFT_1291770 [Mycena alexandri]|uniref:Uncharacterized protein n=1 Tax=Mycena alexandri TaxID=1745969 RepID=A0AAD6SJN4_9AGAR|nr:hypothetical protein C8F04DRAFT_1291770 [Mycena alexandri]